jgi:hypothetical protein
MACLKPGFGYAKTNSKILQRLFRHPGLALASHWVFQSIFYLDPTERRFKIVLDLVLTIFMALLLGVWFSWRIAWPVALFIAHTLNFLLNGHLWGVLKHYGIVRHSPASFRCYVNEIAGRAAAVTAVKYVVVYGSLAREEWSPTSDLDARVIRYPGRLNGLRACWFVLGERARALLAGFPLDMYLIDDERSLQKLETHESPVYLFYPQDGTQKVDLPGSH